LTHTVISHIAKPFNASERKIDLSVFNNWSVAGVLCHKIFYRSVMPANHDVGLSSIQWRASNCQGTPQAWLAYCNASRAGTNNRDGRRFDVIHMHLGV